LGSADRGWVHLASDEVRKELSSMRADESGRAPWGEGIYSEAATAATYDAVLQRAGTALAHGESVIIDASWSVGRRREQAAAVAARTAADLIQLECRAPEAVVTERLAARTVCPDQPSDADAAVADQMRAHFDPWPAALVIDTSTADARNAVNRVLDQPG